MNGYPITLYGAPPEVVNDLMDKYGPEEIESAQKTAKEFGGKVFVDIEDFRRMQVALVESMKKAGMTYAALFVIKQLSLEDIIGIAPEKVTWGYQSQHNSLTDGDIIVPGKTEEPVTGALPLFGSPAPKVTRKKK